MTPLKHTIPLAALGLALAGVTPPPAETPAQAPAIPTAPARAADPQLSDAQVLERLGADTERVVALGELAADKAISNDLRTFARDLAKDAKSAKKQIDKTSKEVGLTVVKGSPEAKKESDLDRLRKLSGAAFDKAVITELHANRVAVTELLTDAAKGAAAKELRALSSSMLTTVERQRDEAWRLMRTITASPS